MARGERGGASRRDWLAGSGQAEEIPVQDDSRALLKRPKEAMDPSGILSPGRYGF